jgi:hypothetical protein
MAGTESRTAWSVVHSYLPEVLDPGPGEANHDGQKDEGDGGYREQDSLVCGAQHQVRLVGFNLRMNIEQPVLTLSF